MRTLRNYLGSSRPSVLGDESADAASPTRLGRSKKYGDIQPKPSRGKSSFIFRGKMPDSNTGSMKQENAKLAKLGKGHSGNQSNGGLLVGLSLEKDLAGYDKKLSIGTQAALLQAKMPKSGDLTVALNDIIFQKKFKRCTRDVLRLAKRITLICKEPFAENIGDMCRTVVIAEELANFSDENIDLMSINIDGQTASWVEKEKSFSVYLLMKHLLAYFRAPEEARSLGEKLKEIVLSNVSIDEDLMAEMIETIGGETSQEAYVLKCLDQGVAIEGHLQIKSNVCPLMTKDVASAQGWQIELILTSEPDDMIQIRHIKKEQALLFGQEANKDGWEMTYEVSLVMSRFMNDQREIESCKVVVTEFRELAPEKIDKDLKIYLKQRFGNLPLQVS